MLVRLEIDMDSEVGYQYKKRNNLLERDEGRWKEWEIYMREKRQRGGEGVRGRREGEGGRVEGGRGRESRELFNRHSASKQVDRE